MSEIGNPSENTSTILPSEAGRAVQFGIAKAFVDTIGPDRFTPDTIKNLARPLSMGMSNMEGARQEVSVRETMARFIGMVAWIAADGNPEKAKQLAGSSLDQSNVDVTSPQFTSTMQYMLQRSKR